MRIGEQVRVDFKRQEDGRMYTEIGTIEKILSDDSCVVYWEYFNPENRFTERYTRVFTAEELYGQSR
jgi:hypothetical protein